jgi:RNA-directed DNA polymerase
VIKVSGGRLKVKHYVRLADDFVIFVSGRKYLTLLLSSIESFLTKKLKLSLHPDKIFIKTLSSGVDFLGWVHFSDHRVLRTVTKRRMFRNFSEKSSASYLGMLKWGNTYKIIQKIKDTL